MSILKKNKILQKVIRLRKSGPKYYPFFEIIVINKNKRNKGRYIEKLGFFNPQSKNRVFIINTERLSFWVLKGIYITNTIKKYIVKFLIK